MALLKTKTLSNGTEGSYWKIVQVMPSKEKLKITIKLSLFKDASYAANGNMNPVGFDKIFIFSVQASDLHENLFLLGYDKIKSVINTILIPADDENAAVYKYPDLAGAIDV